MTTLPSLSWALTARWVFPVGGPPLENGVVAVAGDRIVAVEPHGWLSADLDLGDAAVLPGLVNAHTHLDLSGLRGLTPPTPHFTDWLRQVIAHRRGRTPEQVQADVRAGLAESTACGVTLLGDISASGLSWWAMTEAPLRAVVFYELLGLSLKASIRALSDFNAWCFDKPPKSHNCHLAQAPMLPTVFVLASSTPRRIPVCRWLFIWRKQRPSWNCWNAVAALLCRS